MVVLAVGVLVGSVSSSAHAQHVPHTSHHVSLSCAVPLLCLPPSTAPPPHSAPQEVGNVAAFLCSPLASAVTGHVMYVDNGLNIMGLAMDSKTLEREA